MEIWRPGRAPQRIVPMVILISGSRSREKEGRETGIMEGTEPNVRKPISLKWTAPTYCRTKTLSI